MNSIWKKKEGFTLVELIVVIAILGILAGVGTVGYSGYIKKANQSADVQLVKGIENALSLSYYANPSEFKSGKILLTADAAPDCGGNAIFEKALTATFGADWSTREDMKLKSRDWSGSFQDSSFYADGPEGLTTLLGTVEGLTGALEGFLDSPNIDGILGTGGSFNKYMTDMGADTAAKKADAAVFYVADTSANLGADAFRKAADEIKNNPTMSGPEALAAMNGQLNNSSLASMAALYAMAEGYATFFETKGYTAAGDSPRTILNNATANIAASAGSYTASVAAFTDLFTAFQQMAGANETAVNEYLSGALHQDMDAYVNALTTVSASRDSIVDSNTKELGDSGYFTTDTIGGIFDAYAGGGVFVYALAKDGVITVSSSIDGAE